MTFKILADVKHIFLTITQFIMMLGALKVFTKKALMVLYLLKIATDKM